MKLFVVSDRSAVECPDRTAAEGWLARFGASAGVWSEESDGVFVAPDGQKIHADSLRQAHKRWRDSNHGKASGATPGRKSATSTTFDAAGAQAAFDHREKIYGAANKTPMQIRDEASKAETMFRHR